MIGVDLVVWPETMFRMTYHHADDGYRPPQELLTQRVETMFNEAAAYLSELSRELNAPVMVGLDRVFWAPRPSGWDPQQEPRLPLHLRAVQFLGRRSIAAG